MFKKKVLLMISFLFIRKFFSRRNISLNGFYEINHTYLKWKIGAEDYLPQKSLIKFERIIPSGEFNIFCILLRKE